MGRFETTRSLVSAALIAALLTTSAQAAMLSNLDGAVSVNYGNGFQPASIGSSLSPGVRVRTGEGSAADIVYDNGCSKRVGPQQVAVVLSAPPSCGGGLKDGAAVAPEEPFVSPLLLGGVAVAGAVGLAVALTNNNNNPSVSP
jgi:hypothetical protein